MKPWFIARLTLSVNLKNKLPKTDVYFDTYNMFSLNLDKEHIFTREFERQDGISLSVKQCQIGDVGCVVWDAAIVLASYLETRDFRKAESNSILKRKTIIELGSGTGIVGLNACCEGAEVTVTDLAEFVPLMNLNIEDNRSKLCGEICAKELKWGQDVTLFNPPADFVLLADCIYYEESLEPLVQTISDLSDNNTKIFCCYEERDTGNKPRLQKQFLQLVDEKFHREEIPLERQHPVYRSEDIHILQFTEVALGFNLAKRSSQQLDFLKSIDICILYMTQHV